MAGRGEAPGTVRASEDQCELGSQHLLIRPIATDSAAVEVCYLVVNLRFDVAIQVPVDTNSGRMRGARSGRGIGERGGRTIKGSAIEMNGVIARHDLPCAKPTVTYLMA